MLDNFYNYLFVLFTPVFSLLVLLVDGFLPQGQDLLTSAARPLLVKAIALIFTVFVAVLGLYLLRLALCFMGEYIISRIRYAIANHRENRPPKQQEIKRFKEIKYKPFDLFRELKKFYSRESNNKDNTFIGLDAQRSNRGMVAIKDADRMKHTQVIGMTGTGKTSGVFLPLFFQDAIKGRPIIFIDPKGEWSTVSCIEQIAQFSQRQEDLYCFLLSHPEYSNTYNPLYAPGCDPDVIIDAFLSNFVSDNSYYRDVSITLFRHAYKILHSLQKPFTVMDIYAYLNNEECFDETNSLCRGNAFAEKHMLLMDGEMCKLNSQHKNWRVGLIGLNTYLNRFDHPLLNDPDGDIDLYECLMQKKMVYFQLPTNAHPVLAAVIGKVVQANLRYLSSLIQTKRLPVDSPVSVIIDEYGTFADENFIEVLNKARSSGMMVTLGHQSMSDLTKISESFMRLIDENTLNKIILRQTDPKFCELVSKSIGTFKKIGRTYREAKGTFGNQILTGEASVRYENEFILHPDRIKNLHPFGQCYFISRADDQFRCVNLNTLKYETKEDFTKNVKGSKSQGLDFYNAYYQIKKPKGKDDVDQKDWFKDE